MNSFEIPFGRRGLRALVGLVAGLALGLGPSCDDPQAPTTDQPAGFRGAYQDGGLTFQIGSAADLRGDLQLVATALEWNATTQALHAEVAVRNLGSTPIAGPTAIEIWGFDPAGVQPLNAVCDSLPCGPGEPCPTDDPTCWFDHRGTYGDDDQLGAGETSSPVEWVFLVPDGQGFGFRARPRFADQEPAAGVISGRVFRDRNGDGDRDADEPGIAGAAVDLQAGAETRRATTDAQGDYAFQVEAPGFYALALAAGGDCRPSGPPSLQVVIVRRADGTLSGFDRGDFGCRGVAPNDSLQLRVTGIVFDDLNADGVHGRGEPGLAGVRVWAASSCDAACCLTSSTVTDGLGRYSMDDPTGCGPLEYVGHDSLAGYRDTTPNPVPHPGDRPLPMPGPGPRVVRVDFGMSSLEPPPAPDSLVVEGTIYDDADADGVRDPDEAGIPDVGVTVSGQRCLSPVAAFGRTDAQGHYRLRGADVHCALPWIVMHEPLAGRRDTTPHPVVLRAAPPAGTDTFVVDFGLAPEDPIPPGIGYSIGGVVFLDANGNGRRDRGESGLPGVQVELLSMCAVYRAVATDHEGKYFFGPEIAGFCPVAAVAAHSGADLEWTTPNPARVGGEPPPGSILAIDFGAVRRRDAP